MKNSYSIKVTLRTDKVLQNGDCPIILRVIINSKQKKINVKERINPKHWDMENCKAIGKEYKDLNNRLDKIKSDLISYCSIKAGNVPITFDLIDRFLKGKKDNDFYTLYDEVVQHKVLKEDTQYKYQLLRGRLKEFRSSIFISDIDYNFIKRFDAFLKDKGINIGGLYNHHKCLKAIFNEALRMNRIDKSPYLQFKFKGVRSKEVFLEEFEVLKIKELVFTSEEKPKFVLSRDIFLFACYTGFRYSDCMNLKVGDIDFKRRIITIVMIKTDDKIVVPFNSQTKGLLCKYIVGKKKEESVFGTISNQVLNRNLKVIANMAKIDKIVTCHVARHTFASYLLNSRNVPLSTVSKLLGHANIATTMIYTNTNFNILERTINEIRYGKSLNLAV